MSNQAKGLWGMIGTWIAVGLVPISELLPWSSAELTFLRGFSCVVVTVFIFLKLREAPRLPEKFLLLASISFLVASFAVFQAIKEWGTNLTIIMLDMAVLVPFLVALVRGVQVKVLDAVVFLIAICGSAVALRVYDSTLNVHGFLWALLALVANGLTIEFSGRVKNENQTEKVFYFGLPIVLCTLLFVDWGKVTTITTEVALLSIIFSLALGYINFHFVFIAFRYLGSVTVGLLLLAMTPIIITSSYFILGKTMGIDQLLGVAIVIAALAYREIKQKKA